MEGTHRADWQLALPQHDLARHADDAAAAGFCAVEVDTAGYADGGSPVAALRSALGAPLSESGDGRLIAFDLRQRRSELETAMGATALARRADQVLRPLTVSLSGRQVEEDDDGVPFQWTWPSAALTVSNMGAETVGGLTLRLELGAPDGESRTVVVETPAGERVSANLRGTESTPIELPITAQRGMNTFRITTDAPAVRLRDDPTVVVFIKVRGITLKSADSSVKIGVKQSLPR
jgi:hypothetical protein